MHSINHVWRLIPLLFIKYKLTIIFAKFESIIKHVFIFELGISQISTCPEVSKMKETTEELLTKGR